MSLVQTNRVDVRKLGQNFDEKSRQKPNCAKTWAYENRGLSVTYNLQSCFHSLPVNEELIVFD